jgi:hypothetical protein
LIGLLSALGPLLRGGWDIWAQSLLFLSVTAGFCAWLVCRLCVGYVPLPSNRMMAWAVVLACLSGLSAYLSPVAAYAVPNWRWLLLGLWIFPALDAVSKDERAAIDQGIRCAAWILVLLAFYQHIHDGVSRPPSAFLNQNVFAGTILMLLPLAAQKEDWLLCAGLLVCLLWDRSVGAWLGLAGALVVARREAGAAAAKTGVVVGLVCLVLIYGKLRDPDVVHRWRWWMAALRMIAARPWLGFGPGSFAYVLPAARVPGTDLSSIYAHQFFLETAAECGLIFSFIFFAGLLHLMHRGGEHKRFGVVAVLIQSCWDYALLIPANFWLFCYFAASSGSQTSRGVNVPMGRKAPYAALALALAVTAAAGAWKVWEADRLKASAVMSYRAGASAADVLPELERSASLAADPEVERYIAELEMKLRDSPQAAVHLARCAQLDPFRASTWGALERLYLSLGQVDAARQARERGAYYLRAAGGL